MKKNQSGFGVIGILVVVLVVGIMGFVGWSVFNNVIKKTNEQAKTTQSQVAVVDGTHKLTIKEWGVNIPLGSADAGAYYVVNAKAEQSASGPTNVIVYSKETDALTGPAGVSCKGEYIAYILRLPSDDPRWQPAQTVDDGNVSPAYINRTVVGNYRYAITTIKQYGPDCFETTTTGDYEVDPITSQKFSDIVKAFSSDFKDIKAE